MKTEQCPFCRVALVRYCDRKDCGNHVHEVLTGSEHTPGRCRVQLAGDVAATVETLRQIASGKSLHLPSYLARQCLKAIGRPLDPMKTRRADTKGRRRR